MLRVEVHSSVPGAVWEEVLKNSVPGKLLGVTTRFASLDDLIRMKEAAGRRDKDAPDLKRLRKFRDHPDRKS